MPQRTCPACGADALEIFFSMPSAPVFCNVLGATREAALGAARAPIELACCDRCELLYNVAFDPGAVAYAAGYENTLDFSPHFRTYQDAIIAELVQRHDLHGKRVVEIGCGQGDFLGRLCAAGGNAGYGFDPSYAPDVANPAPDGVTIVPDVFHPRHLEADAHFVCCRHVLEHIAEPLAFLRELRASLGDRHETIVFFEVPNGLWTVEALGIWDIIYEHCSYFVPASLSRLFARAGFDVRRVEPTYSGQFLTIEAVPAAGAAPTPSAASLTIAPLVERFALAYETMAGAWGKRLAGHAAAGQRVALWGAGSKGVTFLNVMRPGLETVPCIVDLNPRKHGRFVPGTGQEVVPPERLAGIDPALVVVMNPVYLDEITTMISELGLSVPVVTAEPPEQFRGGDSQGQAERAGPRRVR